MKLFESIQIGHIKIKNRIAFAPTYMGYCSTRGEVTDQVLCHYSARAKGGAGLIIVEGTGITGKYAFTMGRGIVCIGDFYRKGLKELAEVIHFTGAKAVVQLVLGQGVQALFSHPKRDLVAPSAVSTAHGSSSRGVVRNGASVTALIDLCERPTLPPSPPWRLTSRHWRRSVRKKGTRWRVKRRN